MSQSLSSKSPEASIRREGPANHSLEFREGAGLCLILLLAAGLRLWRLDQNGFGNPYYAAAVRSMLMSWHNFIFASFDPTGYVSVDKPPVALWLQALSARLLGFSGFSLIFPQVMEGCLSVALVYFLVRRWFTGASALLAAFAMATAPVSVAVDRYNNVDSCLVLVLLLAALAMGKAVEVGSRGFLMLSMALMGIGFNVKMMAAFVALPAFYALYAWMAPVKWNRRLADLTAASLVLGVTALSWPLYVDLTPPEQRPYVGSTQDNSMIGLSLGWNGFNRLLARRRPFPGNPNRPAAASTLAGPGVNSAPATGLSDAGKVSVPTTNSQPPAGPRPPRGRGMGTGEPGPLRLADKNMAGQFAWLFPLALLGLWAAWKETGGGSFNPQRSSLFLWAGWTLCYALVFSFMRGGMHTYYLVLLAPPLSALAGIGATALWRKFKTGGRDRIFLPTAFFLTAAWQFYLVAGYPDWKNQLLPLLSAGAGVSLLILAGLAKMIPSEAARIPWNRFAFLLGLASLLFCPCVWALTPVLGSGQSVEASPDLLTGNGRGGMAPWVSGNSIGTDRLMAFLKSNHRNEKYLLAAQSSQPVAPLIIQTGEPVVAIGGFMGADPTVTVNEFARMVEQGQFRYMMISGQGGLNRPNGQVNGAGRRAFPGGAGNFGNRGGFQFEIAQWVRQHGRLVDPKLWKPGGQPEAVDPGRTAARGASSQAGRGGRRGMGFLQLYDFQVAESGTESPDVAKGE